MNRFGLCGVSFGLRGKTVLGHKVQNQITAFLSLHRIDERGILTRSLWNPCQQGCLANREILCLFAEVGLGGSFYAVGIRAQKNIVGVQLHDLVFRVIAFDLERHSPLVHFPCDRLLLGQK